MPRRKISVLILYNSPRRSGAGHAFAESEAGVLFEVATVSRALDKLRLPHRAVGVRRFEELPAVLAASDEPVVFNLVEGFWADEGQANVVPTVICSFGKACTGNDTHGLLLSLDKWQSKTLLRAAGLPVPRAVVVHPGQPIRTRDLFDGPYIVKPVQTDGSEGIDNTNLVRGKGRTLQELVRRIHDRQAQPAIIEQYIEGRELNASVIWRAGRAGMYDAQALPLAEIDFSAFGADQPRILGYEAKWLADSFEYDHTPRIIPAPLPKRLAEQIRDLAVGACRALACEEYCRVDFRLDGANRPYILEVNANPDISPDAGVAAALEAAGISYAAFVKMVIENALARAKRRQRQEPKPPAGVRRASSEIGIRWCESRDRQVVLSFLAQTGFFRPDEIETARELVDEAIAKGPEGHYQSFVAEAAGETVGWVCYGQTPCTLGTFDIYWIGVSPDWQGRGIGRTLTAFAERAIAELGGRLLVVETSSRQAYDPTRRFYEALGYRQAACITDFYGPQDHKVIFTKAVQH